jgi:hypothetical protein
VIALLGSMKRLLRRIDRFVMICVVLGAGLVGSQLAEFMQQYTQNLSGRRAEAQYEVRGLVARADDAEMPLGTYLSEFSGSSNPVFAREGQAMRARIERATALDEAYHELRHAGLLAKPFVFAAYADPRIVADVWGNFRPALPLDSRSLIYCVLLMACAALAYRSARVFAALPGRAIRRARGGPVAPDVRRR